jgi:tetratricopeptide (TPR) repeat protein
VAENRLRYVRLRRAIGSIYNGRYNNRMRVRSAVTVVVLSAGMFAQSAPPSCPAERPVDDIITEVHKQQAKKKHRNPNPFPDVTCIWGWCRSGSDKRTPPTVPESAPPEPVPQAKNPTENESSSSSRPPVDKCDEAMERALKAAHDVEVGDEYFEAKNYNAALQRYKDAADEKPGDAAIHVRLGRVFEKVGQIPQAIEQYQAAQELAGPKKWLDEAKAALLRLQRSPGS